MRLAGFLTINLHFQRWNFFFILILQCDHVLLYSGSLICHHSAVLLHCDVVVCVRALMLKVKVTVPSETLLAHTRAIPS